VGVTNDGRGDDVVADLASETDIGGSRAGTRRAHRTLGALIGAVGALGVAASAYLDWFAGQMPTEIPLQRLFDTEVSGTAGAYWTSMAAPLALAGVIGVLGAVLRSRLVITIAGLLGLSTLVLWILLQAIDLSPEDLRASDYEVGLWVCVASLVVLTGGVLLMGSPPVEESPAPDEAGDQQDRLSTEG
jgi:hypothetical protein